MKTRLLTSAVTLFLAASAHAQTVNGVPLKDLDTEYVHIIGETKMLSDKINLVVDYGQERKRLYSKPMMLMDADNREMEFNSMIDALNFMARNGYELVESFGVNKEYPYPQHLMHKKRKD